MVLGLFFGFNRCLRSLAKGRKLPFCGTVLIGLTWWTLSFAAPKEMFSPLGRWAGACTKTPDGSMQVAWDLRPDREAREAYRRFASVDCSGEPLSVSALQHRLDFFVLPSGSIRARFELAVPRGNTPKAREYEIRPESRTSASMRLLRLESIDGSFVDYPGLKTAPSLLFRPPTVERGTNALIAAAHKAFSAAVLEAATEAFRKAGQYPSLVGEFHYESSPLPLPNRIVSEFQRINLFLFGRPEFELVRSSKERGWCDLGRKTIGIDPNSNAALSASSQENADRFVLAHEFSHYVHQFLIENDPQRQSPHGLGSTINFLPRRDWEIPRRDRIALGLEWARRHAEIDAIASVILRKLGNSDSSILDGLEKSLSSNEAPANEAPASTELDFLDDLEIINVLERSVRLLSGRSLLAAS